MGDEEFKHHQERQILKQSNSNLFFQRTVIYLWIFLWFECSVRALVATSVETNNTLE
jgi:hypothetical protein